MKREMKKVFSFILVLMLIFSLIPSPVSLAAIPAELGIEYSNADGTTPAPSSLEDGQIWTDKSVKSNGDGTFDITLKAIGQNYALPPEENPNPLDIVFVLDVSLSMTQGGSSKLADMKSAAQGAVDILLGVEGNRVAVMRYSNDANLVEGFTTNAAILKTKIGQLNSESYTNIQDGFRKAQGLINSRSDKSRNPVIILMSDGAPTRWVNYVITHQNNISSWQQDTSTPNNAVWWTIEQAMYTKTNGTPNTTADDIDIYTIGFGVGSDNKAIATLMPTESNTAAYRTTTYSGERNTSATQSGTVQYYRVRSANNNSWSNWQLTSSASVGDNYKEPVIGAITGGSWSSFSGFASEPVNSWGNWNRGSGVGSTITIGTGGGRIEIRDHNATRTGTAYRNIVPPQQFNHKYWSDGSSTNSSNADEIFDAFVELAKQLTNFKPMSYTLSGDTKVYSNVTITDVLGPKFELVDGTLTAEEGTISYNATTHAITWTINGNELTTLAAGEDDPLDPEDIPQATFKVIIKSDAAAGPEYLTNTSASSSFTAANKNPYYGAGYTGNDTVITNPDGTRTVTKALPNTGRLKLNTLDINTSIQITKEVVGPVGPAESRTFEFNVYYNLDENGNPGANNPPINTTTVSIEVTGEDSESVIVPLTIPSSEFNGNGLRTLYVKEMSTTDEDFWEYDTWHTVTVDKNSQEPANVNFTNTYDPKGTLTVTKVWSGVSQGAIEFQLLKEVLSGEGTNWVAAEPGTRQLTGPDWSTTIGNLELGTKYRVLEIDTGLYDYTIGYNPLTVEFSANELTKAIEITNTYVQPEGKITINKEWVDNDNEAGDRPDEIVFTYTGPENTSGTIKLEASKGWTNTLTTTIFGEYTFTEGFIQDYVATEATQSVTIYQEPVAERNASLTFENTYVEPKGEITVTKQWTNENANDTSYRPSNGITIRLLKLLGIDSETNEEDWSQVDVATLTSGTQPNMWIHTFTNLTMGTYKVTEDPVDDYTTTISDAVTLTKKTSSGAITSRNGEITVENSFDNPTGSITVNKIWTDDEITSQARPDSITIVLLKDGAEIGREELSGAGHPATTWTNTFDELPLDGSTYTVEEVAVANYDSSITYGGIGASNDGIVLDKDHRTGTATVSNTYAKGVITVKKFWDHTGNTDQWPDSVDVTLMVTGPETVEITTVETYEDDEGETATREAITTETITTTREVGTKTITSPAAAAVFYNLDMGENYKYFVVESNVPLFYEASYSVTENDPLILTDETPTGEITVTNTYVEPEGKLTVNKHWNHGNNPSRPSSVTVNLYANNGQTPVQTATLSAGNNWTYTFEGLKLGYSYTISEEKVDNYDVPGYNEFESYTPTKAKLSEEVVITNTYIAETGALKVTKEWDGTTGGPITIHLTQYDGDTRTSFSQTATLSTDNEWTYTFENLELYGTQGLYSYHIAESGAGVLYSQSSFENIVQMIKDHTTVITIVNKYEPYKGVLTIEKKWIGLDGNPMNPPEITIEAVLVEAGDDNWENAPSYLLNADNNWTVTVGGLNVDKTYRVIELNSLQEFAVTYNTESISFSASNLNQTVTITNTRTPDEPSIQIDKELFNSGTILDDGSATLRYALHITNNGERKLTEIYVLDQMVPSGTAVGAKLDYTTGEAVGNAMRIDIPGGLDKDASTVVYYNVTVDKAGFYDNEATVYGHFVGYYNDEWVTAADTASGEVKPPGLNIVKEVIGASSRSGSGGTFNYRLTISYDGEIPLTDVIVWDEMVSTNADATMTYNYSGSDFDPTTKTFTIGDLFGTVEGSEGDEIVINYSVTVNGRGTYNNTATVTGNYRTVEVINDEEILIEGDLSASDDASVSVTRPSRPDNPDPDPEDPDNPDIIIPEEDVPEGAIPDVTLPDDQIPAAPLPRTGGLDSLFIYGLGALLAGGGLFLRRRENKAK